jgi:hypothetical protein
MDVNTIHNAFVLDAVKDKEYFRVVHPNASTDRLRPPSQPYRPVVSPERSQRGGASIRRKVGRCGRKDVVDAFRIVGQEIRTRCQRIGPKALTQAEACRLALRVRDQRELIRELTDGHDSRHVLRLLRLNRKLRQHLVAIAEQAGLNTSILIFK